MTRDVTASGNQRRHDEAEKSEDQQDQGGQVSEVDSLEDAGEEIYPDQAVAGYPDSESGSPDEGPAGPDAVPEDHRAKR